MCWAMLSYLMARQVSLQTWSTINSASELLLRHCDRYWAKAHCWTHTAVRPTQISRHQHRIYASIIFTLWRHATAGAVRH